MSSNPKHLGLPVSPNTPEGYEFSYMHIQAVKYINELRDRVYIEPSDEPLLDDISPIVNEALEDMEDELAAQDDPASILQGHPSWTGFLHLYCAYGHWRFAEYDEAVEHLRKLHNLAKSNEIRRLNRRFGEIEAQAYELTRYPNFPDMPEYPPKPGRENVRRHFVPRSERARELAEEAEAMNAGLEGMALEEKEGGAASAEAETEPIAAAEGVLETQYASSPPAPESAVESPLATQDISIATPFTSPAASQGPAVGAQTQTTPSSRIRKQPPQPSPEKPPARRVRFEEQSGDDHEDSGNISRCSSGSDCDEPEPALGHTLLRMVLSAPPLAPNEVYVASGSIPELGLWNPTQSPVLSHEVGGVDKHGAYTIFKTEIELPLWRLGKEFEFKFARIDANGGILWELHGRKNRICVCTGDFRGLMFAWDEVA